MKIESLTPSQISAKSSIRDEWIRIGLSTDPADRPRAEAAIREMYQAGGLVPPGRVIWCGSPLSMYITRNLMSAMVSTPGPAASVGASVMGSVKASVKASVWNSVRASVVDSVGASVKDSVWDSVRASVGDSVKASVGDSVVDSVGASVMGSVKASVWNSVWNSVRASVMGSVKASVEDSVKDSVKASVWNSVMDSVRASVVDSVKASVWNSVWNSVKASVWNSVRASVVDSVGASVKDSVWASIVDSVMGSVWASVRASVGASVRASVWDSVHGQHDAHWLAFYDYFARHYGMAGATAPLNGLMGLARSAGWAIPTKNACFVSERHNVLLRDEQGRLHCETGPACAYPDGFAIHAWHGTCVPAAWIERKHELTPQSVLAWENIEQRRAACEILGWAKILTQLNARIIDEDHPRIGTLVEVELPNSNGPERFLRVQCGTGREFALPVGRAAKTAFEANLSTYPQLNGLPHADVREAMIKNRT